MPDRNLKSSPSRLHEHFCALGPMPKVSLETSVDLGLTDAEIGDYFRIPRPSITKIRKILVTDRSVRFALSRLPAVIT